MNKSSFNALRGLAVISLCLAFGMARAQDSEPYEPDPPDRAARLSYTEGDVSMQPAGEEEWAPAIVNRPLTTGDKLWTGRDARAEIYVGPAAIRLADDTGFSFLNVDDDTIQMRMTAGVIYVSIRALNGSDHIEIDTPQIALSILRPGNYRVEVNNAGDATTVKVTDGEAEADGPAQNVIVHAQQVVTFRGFDELVAQWGTLGDPDEFDSWSLDRERRYDLAATSRTAEYVSPDVTGYEDLEDNGSWSSEPDYGYVWTPRVAMGWAPYQYGRWVSVAPWGWTWIDDPPWGSAPFHYGSWAHVRERWCWVPGPRHVRAVYAPALVGWIGPPGVRVGWFPLGPREVYVPYRRYSHRYLERVNVSNTVIVNRTYLNEVYNHRRANVPYRNRGVPGAVTSVARETFASGGRVGDHRVRGNDSEFAHARVTEGPQVAPGRDSRFGGAPRMHGRVPPPTVENRQVIVKRAPPPSVASFARSRSGQEDFARGTAERFSRPLDRPASAPRVDRPVATTNLRTEPNVSVQRPAVERPREERPRDERPPSAGVTRENWQTRQRQEPDAQAQLHQRERQVRELQAQRDANVQQQQQQREHQDNRDRQQQEQQQRQQHEQRQQQEPRQQQERVRTEERSRAERPQETRASRPPEPRQESKPQSQPQRQHDNWNRPNKD